MKHKTLFRLLLKIVGICFFLDGIAAAATHSGVLLHTRLWFGPDVLRTWTGAVLELSPGLINVAAGLYLFFGGEWIVNKAIPSNRPYCHECGYDLTAAIQNRCPECGTPFRNEDVQPPTGFETKEQHRG